MTAAGKDARVRGGVDIGLRRGSKRPVVGVAVGVVVSGIPLLALRWALNGP